MPPSHSDKICNILGTFLQESQISTLYFAQPGGKPPHLAYITAFPRLSLTLNGSHPMQIAGPGTADWIRPTCGEAVIVLPNRWNKPGWSEPGTVLTFLFGPRQIGISLISHEGLGTEPVAEVTTRLARPLDNVTTGLIATLGDLNPSPVNNNVNLRVVDALLHAILLHLQLPQTQAPSKPKRTFDAICLYIQENAQYSISRETIASQFGLSPTHVSRLFRTEGAMRFSDYLNLARINRAKVLLRESRSTVKEIAADCGFTDNAYFCRVFQRFVKKTPTRYRLSR